MGRGELPGDEQTISEREESVALAVAEFLAKRNEGQPIEIDAFASQYPELEVELHEWLGLFEIPVLAGRTMPDRGKAWEKFKTKVFTGEIVASPSLGEYVQQSSALNAGELAGSGLSPEVVEALKKDATPLNDLKNYGLADYAALAKRYGVKDAAFPRMLKWLKNAVKSLSAPATPTMRGMVFARDSETRTQNLSEAEILEALKGEEEQE
jgi:hypothetical protein